MVVSAAMLASGAQTHVRAYQGTRPRRPRAGRYPEPRPRRLLHACPTMRPARRTTNAALRGVEYPTGAGAWVAASPAPMMDSAAPLSARDRGIRASASTPVKTAGLVRIRAARTPATSAENAAATRGTPVPKIRIVAATEYATRAAACRAWVSAKAATPIRSVAPGPPAATTRAAYQPGAPVPRAIVAAATHVSLERAARSLGTPVIRIGLVARDWALAGSVCLELAVSCLGTPATRAYHVAADPNTRGYVPLAPVCHPASPTSLSPHAPARMASPASPQTAMQPIKTARTAAPMQSASATS
jgi:hypothetical protein